MNKIIPEGITFDDVLLVPKKIDLQSRSEVDTTTQLTLKISLKTPIISANMDTVTESAMAIAMARVGGIGFIHRFLSIEDQAREVSLVKKQKLLVGAAIGIKGDYLERTEALLKAKVDVLVIDIAHGHSTHLIATLKTLKKTFPKAEFIAGNVATYEATADLIAAGASGIKVGIGPGALCSTRVVAGSGVPQITAIMEAARAAHEHNIPIIADGGIRYSGDIAKALAAGASTVMIGTMFAGCEESPAVLIERDGQKYKITRGMASLAANQDRKKSDTSVTKDLNEYAQEGVEGLVSYKGSVEIMVKKLMSGAKSGFSYSGARNIPELWEKAQFIKISNSGLVESHPHDVQMLCEIVK